jgi:peptidoglycan hydrolase-like protein with peptidoglycan-binding domain
MAGIVALGAASAAVVVPASATASTAPRLGSRTLKTGSRGVDVIALQRDLTQSGFAIRVTGVYDAATAHTVARFARC